MRPRHGHVDELVLVSRLDHTWRTVPAIKRLWPNNWPPEGICEALRRLAKAGRVQQRLQPLDVPVFGRRATEARSRVIEYYRRAAPDGC
jgi:hypothetical protein